MQHYASNTYSAFNKVKFDTKDSHDQFLLYNQFATWNCNGCSIVPLTDYVYHDIYKELTRLKNFFTDSEEKLYIDLKRCKGYTGELERLLRDDSDLTLKVILHNAAIKQMRLRVTGYYQCRYLYTLPNKGLVLTYKDYWTAKDKDVLTIKKQTL